MRQLYLKPGTSRELNRQLAGLGALKIVRSDLEKMAKPDVELFCRLCRTLACGSTLRSSWASKGTKRFGGNGNDIDTLREDRS